MIRWIPYTFVRTVLFFIAGILLGVYAPDLLPEPLALALVALLFTGYFVVVAIRHRWRRPPNPGLIGLSLVLLLGYLHVIYQTESRDPDHLVHHRLPVSHYKAIITSFTEEKARSWKTEARVLEVRSGKWYKREGNVILYFSKDDFPEPYAYGDILLLAGQPRLPDAPGNPGEFDYKAFLALKNIYHQHFLRGGDVTRVDHDPPNSLLDFAYTSRRWAAATLNRFVDGAQERAIASALVLGVTDGLDNELLAAYAGTGAMHILAVSGLHVSILYFILLRILKPVNRLPAGKWLVAFTALAALWLYALVTGLSPSVLRAVTMFSFLAIARPWVRTTNVYNTLAVSAFCLLIFDPFLIRSVGFQLSYLAVLGIVYLYPRIVALWEPQHIATVEIWKIIAVSLAAQLATFPLGLLYFHQFPNYFLLSNLLVVPLSSVVLVLGLTVLVVSYFSLLAGAAGYCLEWVIRLLNGIVFTLEDLPFSVTQDVYITGWQCASIIAFIVFALALFQLKKFRYVVLAFSSALLFAALQWWNFSTEVSQRKLVVYKVPGHLGLDLMERGETWFVADSALWKDGEKIRYHITPNRLRAGIGNVHADPPTARSLNGNRIIVWRGQNILLVHHKTSDLPLGGAFDWVIIGNNALDSEALSGLACKKVILDSSNSFFFASRFLEAAKLHKLEVHSVLHQGAFISKIENRDT